MALEDDIARVASNSHLSPSTKSLVAEQMRARAEVGAADFRKAPGAASLSHEVPQYQAAVGRALIEYQRTRERDAWGHTLLNANNHLVMGAIAVATIVAPPAGVTASLALAGTQFALDKLTTFALDELDTHAKKAAHGQLRRHLRLLRDQHNVDLGALSGVSVEEARTRVLGAMSGVLAAPDFGDLDAETQAVVHNQLGRALDDAIVHQLALNGLADEARDETLGQLVASYKALRGFQTEATARLDALDSSVRTLGAGLEQLHAAVASNQADLRAQSEDIQFLKDFTFGRMSPTEQREALERGLFPDMPADRREALTAKLRLVEARESIVSTAQTFLNGAGIVANVLEGLDLAPGVVNAVRRASVVGQAALATFTALSSGNILGAVGALSGLIFGGGKDVATQRHEQIMGALDALARGQQAILENQQRLLEGQRAILENQRRIYEAIGQLSEQIQRSHLEITNSLRTVRDEILVNRVLLQDLVNQPGDELVLFMEKRGQDESFDFDGRGFRSYEGMRRHFSAYGIHFKGNAVAFAAKIGQRTSVDPIFLLDTYAQPGDTWNVEPREAFLAMNELLGRACQVESVRRNDVAALLLLPSATWKQSIRKLATLRSAPTGPAAARAADFEFIGRSLGPAVASQRVLQVARWCVEGHAYFSLLEELDDTRLPTPDQLAQRDWSRPNAKILLKDMLTIVDLGIAQAALAAGDMLLDATLGYVRDALHAQASGTPPAPVGQAAIVALSKNPLFAANWVRHMVRAALAESETTAFSYDGLLFAGPAAVKEVLPGNWELVGVDVPAAEAAKDSAPVALRLPGGGQIRLPRGRDVHEANLVHAPELEDLLAAKNLLLDALMDYRLADRVPADIGRVLAHLAVLRPLHVT